VTTEPEVSVSSKAEAYEADPILPPATMAALPPYHDGWQSQEGRREPFLSYTESDPTVNWSAGLEALHEESSRAHFIDRWTRQALISGIGDQPASATIADVGCSTGYLLEDLRALYPGADLIGLDLIAAGLRKAHDAVPSVRLLQADACALPLADASIDAIVSANLLEHIPDDRRALREIARVLKPGARAAIVVPAGPSTFDYYDRFLGHERRYARHELASKCADAGMEPREDSYIASLIYPAFWLVKRRNRWRYDGIDGDELEARVAENIASTRDSRGGELSWKLERRLQAAGVRFPFGIRSLVVAQRRREA
jgi:SAM-dependent methyltransferase